MNKNNIISFASNAKLNLLLLALQMEHPGITLSVAVRAAIIVASKHRDEFKDALRDA